MSASERLAAIDIGSSGVRMTIAEKTARGLRVLEDVSHPIRLGADVVESGKFRRDTMNECVRILGRLKELCDTYRVVRIRACVTSSVREAENLDILLDNIRTATGIEPVALSSAKRSEFIYRAITRALATAPAAVTDSEDYSAIIDVGAGQIEVTLFDSHCLILSRALPLSPLKVRKLFDRKDRRREHFARYFRLMIDHELNTLKRDIPPQRVSAVYGLGPGLDRLTAGRNPAVLTRDELEQASLQAPSEEEAGVLTLFAEALEFFGKDRLLVPTVSLRDGILEDMTGWLDDKVFFERLGLQLTTNALNIGRSLNFDEPHARQVCDLSLALFDATTDLHRLGPMERCYLLVASLLHDIGQSVSYRLHHKHSLYLIRARDFFYLDDTERDIIANVARYHRRSPPKKTHPDYMALPLSGRMTVMKLAALLRLADALDNTHLQLVESLSCTRERDGLVLRCKARDELIAERLAVESKKNLFEDFFGIPVRLETERLL